MKLPNPLAPTRVTLAAALLALALLGGGCQSARLAKAYTQADHFKGFVGVDRSGASGAFGTLYRVAPPDTLHITVLRGGDAVDHRVTLPPDGRLLLPGLAWPVNTTGLNPGEIAEDLQRAIASSAEGADDAQTTGLVANQGLTLDPAALAKAERQRLGGADPVYVAVRVERFASRQVFVFGQVSDPGAQAWDGKNRLSTVLAAAGPGHRADLHRVLVLRPGPDDHPRRRLVVAAQRLLNTGDSKLDVALDPGDIVFVPATGLGRVGLAIDRMRPRPIAGAEWVGGHPAPFFPPVAPTGLVVTTTADAPNTPAEQVDAFPAVVDPTDAHAASNPVNTAAPGATTDADGPRALILAGDPAGSVADPFAPRFAGGGVPTLLPIRVDAQPLPPALTDTSATDESLAGTPDVAVRFWAP